MVSPITGLIKSHNLTAQDAGRIKLDRADPDLQTILAAQERIVMEALLKKSGYALEESQRGEAQITAAYRKLAMNGKISHEEATRYAKEDLKELTELANFIVPPVTPLRRS